MTRAINEKSKSIMDKTTAKVQLAPNVTRDIPNQSARSMGERVAYPANET